MDFKADGWSELVEETKPNVVDDAAVLEIKKLRKEVKELTSRLQIPMPASGTDLVQGD